MLHWALDALDAADCEETVVVVGHQAEAVRSILPDSVGSALQAEQLGTGHAAMVALETIEVGPDDDVFPSPRGHAAGSG